MTMINLGAEQTLQLGLVLCKILTNMANMYLFDFRRQKNTNQMVHGMIGFWDFFVVVDPLYISHFLFFNETVSLSLKDLFLQ